jgi:hypothetical protein
VHPARTRAAIVLVANCFQAGQLFYRAAVVAQTLREVVEQRQHFLRLAVIVQGPRSIGEERAQFCFVFAPAATQGGERGLEIADDFFQRSPFVRQNPQCRILRQLVDLPEQLVGRDLVLEREEGREARPAVEMEAPEIVHDFPQQVRLVGTSSASKSEPLSKARSARTR